MTLPTPDAQSARFLSQQSHSIPPTHSIPPVVPHPLHHPATPQTPIAPPTVPATEPLHKDARTRDVDFADHSWNLATGGLKTLTAKRELPPGLERRMAATDNYHEAEGTTRSYTFALVVLACVVVMLISGGIVLFMMLQP